MRSVSKLSILLLGIIVGFGAAGCKLMNKLEAREHLNTGVKAYAAKKYDEASEEFRNAIELDPELKDAYLYLGAAYRAQFVPFAVSPENLRKGQEAIATFEKVMELEPDSYRAIANIADLYRNMSEPDKAKEWYRKLANVMEDKSEALYGIASIDYNLSDEKTGSGGENVENLTEEQIAEVHSLLDEAISTLKEALEIRTDYADAMEYLNLCYREKAELAKDDEERRNWEREADKLALQVIEARKRKKAEEERKRREVFSSAAGTESE